MRYRAATLVLDWTVPQEWHIRDGLHQKRSRRAPRPIFHQSNLHVVNYSVPVHATMTLSALRPHLFSLPRLP